jgi:DNA-binding transcriptional LysR family regulator
LLVERLIDEDIEFVVAESRSLPADPRLQIRALRREAAGFYVGAGHPLAGRRALGLAQIWEHGVASVRLPQSVRDAIAKALGPAGATGLLLALECDDVAVLKAVALGGDTVLAAPHAAVAQEAAAGTLVPLAVGGLPALYSEVAIVTLRGRTPSPMAELILERLRASSANGRAGP